MAAKRIGVCGNCGRDVWGPPYAKFRGTTKQCKHCRNRAVEDDADRSERRYFEKFSAEYQMETQGFVSSP